MSGADASGALVLGVDGGGSRCAAVLARVPPAGGVLEILGRGRGGPANPRVAGHEWVVCLDYFASLNIF